MRLRLALVALALLVAAPASAAAAPGDIMVADEGSWFGSSGRVLRLPSGGAPALLAGGAPLSDPWAVAVMADGALLVVDEGAEAVFSIAPSGTISTIAGGGRLQDPVGLALGPDGQAYVSDRQRDEVLRLDLETGTLTHVAELESVTGLAMDGAGKLLATDGTAVRRIDPGTGAITTVAAGAPLADPRDVAVGLDGTLFVAGDHQVVRVNPATGAKTVLAAGQPLDDPRAIDIEPDGDLVVADGQHAGGAVIHVDRETGAKQTRAAGGIFRVPAGLGVVGGAGVDPSGGGNGDPDGPAAPPDPVEPGPPAGPGGGGFPGTPGTPGGGPGGGGITVTLPDGRTVTLPPGVTAATSGIRGIDHSAPSFTAQAQAERDALPRRPARPRVRRGPHRHHDLLPAQRARDRLGHRPEVPPPQPRLPPQGAQEPPPHRHALPQVDLGQGPVLEGQPGRDELRALPRPAQGQGAQARRLPLRDPRPRRRRQRERAEAPEVPDRPLGPGAPQRERGGAVERGQAHERARAALRQPW